LGGSAADAPPAGAPRPPLPPQRGGLRMGGTFLRPAVLLAPVAIGLACWYACPGGPDWSLARELLREQRRGEALDRCDRTVSQRLEAKARVTAEVIGGGLTLDEAARRFGEVGEAVE